MLKMVNAFICAQVTVFTPYGMGNTTRLVDVAIEISDIPDLNDEYEKESFFRELDKGLHLSGGREKVTEICFSYDGYHQTVCR